MENRSQIKKALKDDSHSYSFPAFKADTILPEQESNAFWSSTDTNAIEGENTGAMALKVLKDGNVTIKCQQKGDFLKVLPFYKHCFPI